MRRRRLVAAATGTRADFGLLKPVMTAIAADPSLELKTIVAGAHLLPPARTVDEVAASFEVAETVEMQRAGETGRGADAAALGRGVSGFARALDRTRPDFLLVLGDRIEAFAAASTAAVAGVRVAHLHGGDRAEGIADESLRHAITRLAHVHLVATATSRERIIRMGEDPKRVHLVGSPAIDGLDAIGPLADAAYDALGRPEILFLLHPTGADEVTEHDRGRRLLAACRAAGRVIAFHPNHDAGRDGILRAIDEAHDVTSRTHLPREEFVGLLRRVDMIVGNSSTGLIEAAAVPVRGVDVGPRQGGRERPPHVITCPGWEDDGIRAALARARAEPIPPFEHPYGDGHTGPRVCRVLAEADEQSHPLAKRCIY